MASRYHLDGKDHSGEPMTTTLAELRWLLEKATAGEWYHSGASSTYMRQDFTNATVCRVCEDDGHVY